MSCPEPLAKVSGLSGPKVPVTGLVYVDTDRIIRLCSAVEVELLGTGINISLKGKWTTSSAHLNRHNGNIERTERIR